jgi:hypothetical protein
MRHAESSMFTVTPAGMFEWLVTVYGGDGQVVERWVRGPRRRAKRVGYRLLRDVGSTAA